MNRLDLPLDLANSGAGLAAIGFLVGMFGTLIGAGGGFILMPVFFYLYPELPPERLTAMSLVVVFFNAASGSIAYARKGRIDFHSGMLFSAASIPGAILGAMSTALLSRSTFDPIFAALLILAGIYLILRPLKSADDGNSTLPVTGGNYRILIDRSGKKHHISYNAPLGIGISIVVGFLSSFLGIGGGIVHVPALIQLLSFPVHIATATSHFILSVMTLFGVLVHLYRGELVGSADKLVFLAPSVVLGAQLGAKLSERIRGKWIISALAVALTSVGLRILMKYF